MADLGAGQYAGVAALVVVSLLAALGLGVVLESWLWILGLVPLGLGLRKLVIATRAHRAGQRASPAVATGLTGVIGVTIANGGDNIAAYTPVFRTIGAAASPLSSWCSSSASHSGGPVQQDEHPRAQQMQQLAGQTGLVPVRCAADGGAEQGAGAGLGQGHQPQRGIRAMPCR